MGQHFFHFLHAPLVAEQLLAFWQQIDSLDRAIKIASTRTKPAYAG
jgi:hypothetical protein